MDYALKLCDPSFTVGVTEEERDAALTQERTPAPEHAHKMAATMESGRKIAVTTTPRHVIATSHESSQVTADSHGSSQVTAALPEPHNRPARPESAHIRPAKPGSALVMPAKPGPARVTPADAPLEAALLGGGGALSRIWLPFHHMDSCTTLQLHITPPQTTTPIIHCTYDTHIPIHHCTSHTAVTNHSLALIVSPHLYLIHTHTHISSTLSCTHREVLFSPV